MNLFSGGGALAHGRVRARHHALHHVARSSCSCSGRDPAPAGAAGPGRGRRQEDQPVHALRHGGPGAPAVDRPRVPVPLGTAAASPTSSRRARSPGPTSRLIILTLTAGTAMIMWLGELITQRGVGNGMSILIFTSVISSLPGRGQRDPATRAAPLQVRVVIADRPRHHRGGRLHGPGAAAHPDPVRQARRRPQA